MSTVRPWRIDDLDRGGGKRSARVVDPMEILAVFLVGMAGLGLLPGLLTQKTAPAADPVAVPTPAAPAVPVAASIARTFALSARPVDPGGCGVLSASSPAPSFPGPLHQLRRVDTALGIAADPWWRWCIAGVRIYDEGLVVIGHFVPLGDPSGPEPPRSVLRSGMFTGLIEGYGATASAEIARGTEGLATLRLRAMSDNGRRTAFRNAAARTGSLGLWLVTVAGPWTFAPVPIADGPLHQVAVVHGVRFTLHDLRLLSDGVATTTYTAVDAPDPAVAMMEWLATDDLGTVYRPRADLAVAGRLPGVYRAFEPVPPPYAIALNLSIRRLYLAPLGEFEVRLPFAP
jgi:hypothetical protein